MTIWMCMITLLAEANFIECAPPIHEICWSVTNYWPFNSDEELTPFNNQADGDPSKTANGTELTLEKEWLIAAIPFDYVGSTLILPDGRKIDGADTFGNLIYQQGAFIHPYWNTWVIGVDIMTKERLFYLECNGEIIIYE